MKLKKKWENRIVYRTRNGSVKASKEGDYAIVEVSNPLLAKGLKSLHGFCEYDFKATKPVASQRMTKEPISKSKSVSEKVVKSVEKSKKSKSKK